MGEFKIELLGRANEIHYTNKEGKKVVLYVDLFYPNGTTIEEQLELKDIKEWEPPFEDEEITIEEKKEILKNISKEMNAGNDNDNPRWRINIDISNESNIVHYNELLDIFYFDYNVRKSSIYKDGKIVETFSSLMKMSESYRLNFSGDFPYAFYKYCKLPKDELIKFKEEINKNKEIQYLLTEFAKWKVNEDKENINQKKFNYGLYALEMLLCETTKEQVKEITKKYIETAKEKNLSFEPFIKRNRELNRIINELQ